MISMSKRSTELKDDNNGNKLRGKQRVKQNGYAYVTQKKG